MKTLVRTSCILGGFLVLGLVVLWAMAPRWYYHGESVLEDQTIVLSEYGGFYKVVLEFSDGIVSNRDLSTRYITGATYCLFINRDNRFRHILKERAAIRIRWQRKIERTKEL